MKPIVRFLLAALALALVTSGGVRAQAGADTHAELIQELLATLNTEQRIALAANQIVELQIERDRRLRRFQPQLEAYVGKYLSWESVLPELVEAYKRTFTEDEVREILAFYSSETGRKALANMTRLVREIGLERNLEMQRNGDELRFAIESAQRKLGGMEPLPAPAQEAPAQKAPAEAKPAQ